MCDYIITKLYMEHIYETVSVLMFCYMRCTGFVDRKGGDKAIVNWIFQSPSGLLISFNFSICEKLLGESEFSTFKSKVWFSLFVSVFVLKE